MEYNNQSINNFKNLSTKEQTNLLENVFNTISKNIYNTRSSEIMSGSIELVDITYNLTADNHVVFDVKIMDNTTGKEKHEFYGENLEQINITPDMINAFKLLGTDTTEMENQLAELENLDKNQDKVSLSELKSLDNQIDQTAISLGLSREYILSSSTIDANQQLKVDSKMLNGENIDANEKISIHYNIRDVIGGDYESYQIIKTTNGNYKLLGIDKNGYAEEISQDKVELISDSQKISLTQENGTSKEANMIVGFRVKSKASDIDNDQIIGLCNDGRSTLTTFYGRGALYQDQIVAENIPSKTYNSTRVRQERLMDTKETDKNDFSINDSINEIAEDHNIDPETLRSEIMKKYEEVDGVNIENIEEIAEDLERTEPIEPEHSLDNGQPPIY